jgi:hypothetical protein
VPKAAQAGKEPSFAEKYSQLTDAALLRYIAESKNRKPN